MKYSSWEDMVDAQAIAFSALCAQNERLTELADKADDGFDFMSDAEQDELFTLWEGVHNNPFFSARCEKEWEEMDKIYTDKERWARMSLANIANSSFFSSDRTISEYAKDIWNI